MSGASWDESFDVVVVGSGAAGLLSSLVVADAGQKPLLIEKSPYWGGTSSISGGGVWGPMNPIMAEAGEADDLAQAQLYLDNVVADVGPNTSRARKNAYLQNCPKMVAFMRDKGFVWSRSSTYPDYYAELPGGRRGRMMEGAVFNGKKLGEWLKRVRPRGNVPSLAFQTDDAPYLVLMKRTWAGFFRTAKIMLVSMFWFLTGRFPMASGQSLTGQLLWLALKNNVPVRLNTALEDLVVENGRVTGVVVSSGGIRKRIEAKRGVMLTSGGFSNNPDLRKQFHELGNEYTSVIDSDTGDAVTLGQKIGAATTMMDEFWWTPAALLPTGVRMPVIWERHLPHGIIVDSSGQRYFNESKPYNEAGRDIFMRNKMVPSIPSWLVMDARHRAQYLFGPAIAGVTPKEWIDAGFFIKADTLDELAAKIKVDAAGLKKTVERFNGFADTGVDLDFNRGVHPHDCLYGDPRVKPNPNLGHIERGPFWAVAIYPGDLGSKGGLLTDEVGRVVRDGAGVIPGLYASGNATASVMGRGYPGPGSTLSAALTFAYSAMRNAMGANS